MSVQSPLNRASPPGRIACFTPDFSSICWERTAQPLLALIPVYVAADLLYCLLLMLGLNGLLLVCSSLTLSTLPFHERRSSRKEEVVRGKRVFQAEGEARGEVWKLESLAL